MVSKQQLIALLEKDLKRFKKSYLLARKLKYGIWTLQGVVASTVVLISVPAIAIVPAAAICLISAPSIALLISPAHKLPRKEKLRANMMFYEYLIQEIKRDDNLDHLSKIDAAIRLWEQNPLYCKPYKIYS